MANGSMERGRSCPPLAAIGICRTILRHVGSLTDPLAPLVSRSLRRCCAGRPGCGMLRAHPPTHTSIHPWPHTLPSRAPTHLRVPFGALPNPFRSVQSTTPLILPYPAASCSVRMPYPPPSAKQRRLGGDRRQQGYSDGRPKRCRFAQMETATQASGPLGDLGVLKRCKTAMSTGSRAGNSKIIDSKFSFRCRPVPARQQITPWYRGARGVRSLVPV